ncbi:MAG: DUF72 domain-containing protein [Comamonas sp.]|nr:DUF72 domain-containing protein [Candidatus Comamonas equi]
MQDDLFGEIPTPLPHPRRAAAAKKPSGVQAVPASREMLALAASLPRDLRMGVSTWSYPGWEGIVWDGGYDPSVLSRKGLSALSQHPLMRTVCVDRTFWRPLSAEQYAQMATQVPDDFRFMVKCPNAVTDALVRAENGQGQQRNPAFLNPQLALDQFVQPCLQGMGHKLGVLVFQLSPLPWDVLRQPQAVFAQLGEVLAATRTALAAAPQVIMAVEVRDPLLLEPGFAEVLQAHGATMCLGLHGKMPPIEQQLPLLRKLWPTPLVCRWNLNTIFGPFGYPAAQEKHQPFDAIRSPDPHTRALLARTIAGMVGAGQPAYVTISNDAEGCAPQSIALLAQHLQNFVQ